jgi:hypothetical protein
MIDQLGAPNDARKLVSWTHKIHMAVSSACAALHCLQSAAAKTNWFVMSQGKAAEAAAWDTNTDGSQTENDDDRRSWDSCAHERKRNPVFGLY